MEDTDFAFQMLEQSDHIVVYKDTQLRYVYANLAFFRLTGLPGLEAVKGKTDREVFADLSTSDQIEEYIKNDTTALSLPAGSHIEAEEKMQDNLSGERYFQTKKFPVYKQNTLIGTGTITSEITDYIRSRNEAEEYNTVLYGILNTIPGTLLVVDKDMNILFYGQQDVQRAQIERRNLVKHKCYHMFQNREDLCPWCRVPEVIKTGKSIVEYTDPDDPREKLTGKSLKIYVAPIKNQDGETIGAIEYGLDVSKLRKLQNQVEQVSREKELFLSQFSNDVKTPMAGLVSLLEHITHNPEKYDCNAYVETIHSSANGILEMMEELIHFLSSSRNNGGFF